MKTNKPSQLSIPAAFTLVELLVVIAVIAILAAMIIPIAGSIRAKSTISRAQAELKKLETEIEAYQHKRGIYPPDGLNINTTNNGYAITPLFYELAGTVYTNNPPVAFQRLHGGEIIGQADVQAIFGMGGFINSAYVANATDNAQILQTEAGDFLKNLATAEYLVVVIRAPLLPLNKSCAVLGVQMDGPLMLGSATTGSQINPWRYVSTNPTNNTSSYDLWVDLTIGGQTKRISNWSAQPQNVK